MTVNGVVGNQYLIDAFCLGCCFAYGTAVLTGNQDIDVTTDGFGSSNHGQCGLSQAAVVMISNYKDAHSDHLRFVLQFVDQLSYVSYLDTRCTGSRSLNLQCAQA